MFSGREFQEEISSFLCQSGCVKDRSPQGKRKTFAVMNKHFELTQWKATNAIFGDAEVYAAA